jgi:hypothetical protein
MRLNPFAFMDIGGDNGISKGGRTEAIAPKAVAGFFSRTRPSPATGKFCPVWIFWLGFHRRPRNHFARPPYGAACQRPLFAGTPSWANTLMSLRHAAARRLELIEAEMGAFPVLACGGREIVLGQDDRHQDFRIHIRVLDSRRGNPHRRTLARLNSLLGRIYLTAVLPFHHAIVRSIPKRSCDGPSRIVNN